MPRCQRFSIANFPSIGVIDEPTDEAWDRAKPVDVLQRRGDDCSRI